MCNLYIMYYTDAKVGTAYQSCTDMCQMSDSLFPADSDVPLPPNPLLEEHALHGGAGQSNSTITISEKMSINLVCSYTVATLNVHKRNQSLNRNSWTIQMCLATKMALTILFLSQKKRVIVGLIT